MRKVEAIRRSLASSSINVFATSSSVAFGAKWITTFTSPALVRA